jgi:RNA polymerase sigma-70 factor, ECF subfamily
VDDDHWQQTLDRARRFDADAWEALYRRLYPRLCAYARRRLTSSHCDDAVSEAFARAMGAIERFEGGPGSFDGWLFGILRNVILEHYRAARPGGPDGAATTTELPSDEAGPLDQLVAGERAGAVRRAFERLDAHDRELLELRVLGELDARAVGAALGKRAGAVRMAQSRALARLGELLGDETEVAP